jgi:glycosyltransferase involved in cell wall biosynthesis
MKGLLLIPALNEQHSIGQVVRAAKARVSDIIVVDDGSSDLTQAAASSAGAIVLRLKKNMGKGEALKVGFRYALEHNCDWVITMDGDGQHDPEDLVNFLPLLGKYDLLLGNRMEDSGSVPLLRRAANLCSSRIVSALCGQRIFDSQTGFRGYKATFLRQVSLNGSHYDLETEVIIKAARQGFRIGHCRIKTIYGTEVSRYKNVRDSLRFLRVAMKSLRALWLPERLPALPNAEGKSRAMRG